VTSSLPLLLLDVDGVLNPFAAPASLLQIPDLPVIHFPPVPFHPRDKLPGVIRYAGQHPLIWIDDALPPQAHVWAAKRRIPVLLIGIDPAEGLTRPVIEQSLQWADHLG
jgi:hypothetical protein